MKPLTLEELVSKATQLRKPAQVPAPEYGVDRFVYMLAPTPDDRDRCEVHWESFRVHEEYQIGLKKFLFAWCLCDESNSPLVDSGQDEKPSAEFVDFAATVGSTFPVPLVERGFEYALKKMGMSKTDVEDLEKNSETTPPADGSGGKQDGEGSEENAG